MKILLVSLHHIEYALELAEALAKGHHVHLILLDKRVKQTVGMDALEHMRQKIQIYVIPFQSFRRFSTIITIYKFLKTITLVKPDILHVQECYNPLNSLLLFMFRYPIVATVHDIAPHPGFDRKSISFWKLALIRLNRKYSYNKIIVHGNALKHAYVKMNKKCWEHVFIIPHGCLHTFQKSSRYNAKERPNTVLFFGRIHKYKGLKYYIEAEPYVSRVIPDVKFIIAGAGDDLSQYAPRLISNPHFEIHDGFVSNCCVASFFQRASIVVLPYIEASQSGIVAIAFAFGKPVIATNVGSLSEMITHDYNGIVVPPKNSKALGNAIIQLLSNPYKIKEFSKNAIKTAHTELGWDYIAKLTMEVYRIATFSFGSEYKH